MSSGSDESEYSLGPEPPRGPRWYPVRPIRTAVLEYEKKTDVPQSVVPPALQAAAGVLFVILYWYLASVVLAFTRVGPFGGLIAFVMFIACIASVRMKLQWTGFIPGMLIFFFVVPLILMVTCGLVMGGAVLISSIK